MALYHGFILGFILGFMSLVFQAASCELKSLVQGARSSADSANLDFLLVMLFRMPLVESVGPSTPGELNPLAPGDSIVVFGFVLSYAQL